MHMTWFSQNISKYNMINILINIHFQLYACEIDQQ